MIYDAFRYCSEGPQDEQPKATITQEELFAHFDTLSATWRWDWDEWRYLASRVNIYGNYRCALIYDWPATTDAQATHGDGDATTPTQGRASDQSQGAADGGAGSVEG